MNHFAIIFIIFIQYFNWTIKTIDFSEHSL